MAASHSRAKRFLALGIPHPNAGDVCWCVADKPDVGVVIYGTRLAGKRLPGGTCSGCGSTARRDAAHQLNHGKSNIFARHL